MMTIKMIGIVMCYVTGSSNVFALILRITSLKMYQRDANKNKQRKYYIVRKQ